MTPVIKIGGNVLDNPDVLSGVLDRCAALGNPFVLVHGGGVLATRLADRMGVAQEMVDGRRVTSAETLEIVTMTYGGLVNKSLVAKLQQRGVNCVGITGADGNLVRAHRRPVGTVDYGYVGDVDEVNASFLTLLLSNNISIVVAPLTHNGMGELLNTNADTMCAEIAIALQRNAQVTLHIVFEHKGILLSMSDERSVLATLHADEVPGLIERGILSRGMLPKVHNAIRAAQSGVRVVIQHANDLGTESGTWVQ